MLSILIPTYHYNAYDLAKVLEREALAAGITYELICRDDGSFSEHNKTNQQINSLTNCKFVEGKTNLGSIGNRLALAKAAQYTWLLFIDADTLPKSKDYLKVYGNYMSRSYDAIFGGFAYQNVTDLKQRSLRFHFGKHREEIDAKTRNNKPYKITISSNFLIRKHVFVDMLKHVDNNKYGLDYLFGALLKQNKVNIWHIDNEVIHLGLDSNKVYLNKVRSAVETLHQLYCEGQLKTHEISLLKAYKVISFFGAKGLFKYIFRTFGDRIEKNLTGKNPNLMLLDIYKLSYMCHL